MDQNAIRTALYGGLTALMNDREYFYSSGVPGSRYVAWSESGKRAFSDLILALTPAIVEAEFDEATHKSQDMVLDALRNNYDDKT
jgi:hypothetical protein